MAYFHCLIGGGSSGGGYELTVTCDADFEGTTITCTDGVTTLTQTCPSASPYEVVFEIPNGGDWTISGVYQSETVSTQINIPESVALEIVHTPQGLTVTPTDDIQTWLACANITDKSYTTLAEVLADRETFETLIADSNACDYMARSTTLASDTTDDDDAMALIGKYDYCSNALLSNATWAEAIAESDYWDSVCNVSVPKMTSNTAPSGTCFAGTIYSSTYDAYKAFDNDNSTRWNNNQTTANDLVGYTSLSQENIKVVKIRNFSVRTFKVQGSNNGTDWTDISEVLTLTTSQSSAVDEYFILNDNTARYSRHCIRCLTGTDNNTNFSINEVQFYGRKSNGATNTNGIIHTANGDTVYYINGQGQQVSIDASDFDFSSLDEGVYTFGSTTAKNPDDLSQDYTKQFKITKSPYGGTTELYLMPDAVKTLYWWGYNNGIESISTANGWTSTVTLSDPAFNTNDIVTVNNQWSGCAISSAIASASNVCCIGLANSGSINQFRTMSAKDIGGTALIGSVSLASSLSKASLDASTLSNFYIGVISNNSSQSTIKALWYE